MTKDITIYAKYFDPIQAELDEEFGEGNVSYLKDNTDFQIDLLKNTKIPSVVEFGDVASTENLLELPEMKDVEDDNDTSILLNLHDKQLIGANHAGFSEAEIPSGYTFEGIQSTLVVPTDVTLKVEADGTRPKNAYFNMVGTPHSPVITGKGSVELLGNIRLAGGYILDTDYTTDLPAGDGIVLTGDGKVTVTNSEVYGGRDSEFYSIRNPKPNHLGGIGIITEAGDISLNASRVHGGNGSTGAHGGVGIKTATGNISVDATSWVTGGKGGAAGTNNDTAHAHYEAGDGAYAIHVTGNSGSISVNGKVWGGNGGGTNVGKLGCGATAILANRSVDISGSGEIRGGSCGAGYGQPYKDPSQGTHPDIVAIDGVENSNISESLRVVDGETYFDVDVNADTEFTVTYDKVTLADSAVENEKLRAEMFHESTGEVIDEHSFIVDMTMNIDKKDVEESELTNDQLNMIDQAAASIYKNSATANKNYKILDHIDITLSKVSEIYDLDNSRIDEYKNGISELTDSVQFTLNIPEHSKGYSDYEVTRLHDGTADVLYSKYDAENETITFDTNKFSVFSLIGISGAATPNYEIEIQVEGSGSVNPGGGDDKIENVTGGSNMTFTTNPSEGWYIHDVLVDGVSVGKLMSYEFKNIQKDHIIKAIFKEKEETPTGPVDPADPEENKKDPVSTTDPKPESKDLRVQTNPKSIALLPQTGDNTHAILWLILVISSALGLWALTRKKKSDGDK